MSSSNSEWTDKKNILVREMVNLGFPEQLGEAVAKNLGSPKAMQRMLVYLREVKPKSAELVVDEMLAICAEIDAWREKKESREAQSGYSAWLSSERRRQNKEDDT